MFDGVNLDVGSAVGEVGLGDEGEVVVASRDAVGLKEEGTSVVEASVDRDERHDFLNGILILVQVHGRVLLKTGQAGERKVFCFEEPLKTQKVK